MQTAVQKQYAYYENGKRLTEGYSLSLADLSVGREIGKLIEAGVTSFKIEGRLRSAEYVSAATEYYRNILDGKNPEESYRKLRRAFNRGNYTKGLAFGQDTNLISAKTPGHIGETVGTVFACDKHELRFRSEQCGQGIALKFYAAERSAETAWCGKPKRNLYCPLQRQCGGRR